MNLFSLFTTKPALPSVEQWATHNAKRATPDDLIAGAIVQSFAKDYKGWKFEGDFNQKLKNHSAFQPTSLSRKIVTKKHIVVLFIFKRYDIGDDNGAMYEYKPVGCEVNGIRMTDKAFRVIYTNWKNMVVAVQEAETVAAKAKTAMETNEAKWNLYEGLSGIKFDGLGRAKSVEGEA